MLRSRMVEAAVALLLHAIACAWTLGIAMLAGARATPKMGWSGDGQGPGDFVVVLVVGAWWFAMLVVGAGLTAWRSRRRLRFALSRAAVGALVMHLGFFYYVAWVGGVALAASFALLGALFLLCLIDVARPQRLLAVAGVLGFSLAAYGAISASRAKAAEHAEDSRRRHADYLLQENDIDGLIELVGKAPPWDPTHLASLQCSALVWGKVEVVSRLAAWPANPDIYSRFARGPLGANEEVGGNACDSALVVAEVCRGDWVVLSWPGLDRRLLVTLVDGLAGWPTLCRANLEEALRRVHRLVGPSGRITELSLDERSTVERTLRDTTNRELAAWLRAIIDPRVLTTDLGTGD